MNRCFVTIHTSTDDDFYFDGCIPELELDGDKSWSDDSYYTGDFVTLEEAVAVCKKQYQHMIDTLTVTERGRRIEVNGEMVFDEESKEFLRRFRKRIRYCFLTMIKHLETIDIEGVEYDFGWNNGNQEGFCRIRPYTIIQLLRKCEKKLERINKKLQSTGYHCVMKKREPEFQYKEPTPEELEEYEKEIERVLG